MYTKVGDIFLTPVSHGEGRFIADDRLIAALAANGQIATQYVDLDGMPTGDIRYNPNDACHAVEGITSPDGRIFGKMAHTERCGSNTFLNVSGERHLRMFEGAVDYFK